MRPRNVIVHHQNLGSGESAEDVQPQTQQLYTLNQPFWPDRLLLQSKSADSPDRALEDMTSHEQYMLRISAGATYDVSKHEPVLVNSEKPVDISTDLIDAKVHLRIKDYRGTLSPHTPPRPRSQPNND
jgi:hypothetical protein